MSCTTLRLRSLPRRNWVSTSLPASGSCHSFDWELDNCNHIHLAQYSLKLFVFEVISKRSALFRQKTLNQVRVAGYLYLQILRNVAEKITHLSLVSLRQECSCVGFVRHVCVLESVRSERSVVWTANITRITTTRTNTWTSDWNVNPDFDSRLGLNLPLLPCS